MKTLKTIAACAALLSASTSFAHGTASGHSPSASGHGGHAPTGLQAQMPWGQAGRAQDVTRTITVVMDDQMRFTPAHLVIQKGETVRLQVENAGQVMHEMVLGTPASLDAHAQMMLQMPGMPHEAPYMAHVAPDAQGDVLWSFNQAGTFDFACLIAGHFEAGMRGTITVQ